MHSYLTLMKDLKLAIVDEKKFSNSTDFDLTVVNPHTKQVGSHYLATAWKRHDQNYVLGIYNEVVRNRQ